MSRIFSFSAALAIVCCVSPLANAAFTVTGKAEVWNLGSGAGDFQVNKFLSPDIDGNRELFTVPGTTAPDPSQYTEGFAGAFDAYLVNAGVDGENDPSFSVSFVGRTILGIVASNGYQGLAVNLMSGFESATGIDISAITGFTETLVTDGTQAIEIHSVNPNNPDSMSFNGDTVQGRVNSPLGNDNEAFVVLLSPGAQMAPVPEPGTIAVWSLCGVCGLVAGRRRWRVARG